MAQWRSTNEKENLVWPKFIAEENSTFTIMHASWDSQSTVNMRKIRKKAGSSSCCIHGEFVACSNLRRSKCTLGEVLHRCHAVIQRERVVKPVARDAGSRRRDSSHETLFKRNKKGQMILVAYREVLTTRVRFHQSIWRWIIVYVATISIQPMFIQAGPTFSYRRRACCTLNLNTYL